MLIGIDDTDSDEGMCTTYLAAVLAEELKIFGTVVGFPYLIRLNPTIPYKTRGNAALGIEIVLKNDDLKTKADLVSFVSNKIRESAEISCEKTNPGAVFIFEDAYDSLRRPLNDFFKKAVTSVIEIEEAKLLLKMFESKNENSVYQFSMKNGRGLIGALAVCGAVLNQEWEETYEYLAYRFCLKRKENLKRVVDRGSLILADQETTPETWDTIDYSKKTKPFPVCVPAGKDPVLFGIRGNSPEAVNAAAEFVISEEIERFQIFKTNQGTDAHLILVNSVSEMKPLHSYILNGIVFSKSETIEGGHDIFKLKDADENLLTCAAFEPTGDFRHVIRDLIPRDEICVFGSFKNETFNLEKIKIKKLAEIYETGNPICSVCEKRMKSAGIGQGFRCQKCKTKADEKVEIKVSRKINIGYYEVPPSARRHLSKPLIRYSKEELEK